MLKTGLESPSPPRLAECSKLQPTQQGSVRDRLPRPSPSLPAPTPSPSHSLHSLQDIGGDLCDACGLGTLKKPERIYSLDSTFPVFKLFVVVFVFHGVRGRGGYLALVLFLFFSRFTRHGADDDDYYYYYNYHYINYCYLHSQYIC